MSFPEKENRKKVSRDGLSKRGAIRSLLGKEPFSLRERPQSNLRLPPPLVSDHLFSATSFPKYQKFSTLITVWNLL